MIPHRLAAMAAALLVGWSCATVRESGRVATQDEGGGVRAAVFADDRARDAHASYLGAIAGTLERRDRDGWRPLFRSLDSSWTVAGLEPGRYRVRFDAALDARGEESALERPLVQAVEVRRGEIVEVEAVLDHVSPVAVAAGAAAVIVAAVLLHEWLDDLDLPTPPRPPAWAVEAAFYVTLDLATDAAVWVPRQRSPQVTSHFPRAGERVAPGLVRVIFALSEPLDPQWLGDDAIEVETAEGLQLAGRLAWDERRWWLTWEPVVDLPAAARLDVVLRGDRVLDPAGLPLGSDYHFEFETTDEDDG